MAGNPGVPALLLLGILVSLVTVIYVKKTSIAQAGFLSCCGGFTGMDSPVRYIGIARMVVHLKMLGRFARLRSMK